MILFHLLVHDAANFRLEVHLFGLSQLRQPCVDFVELGVVGCYVADFGLVLGEVVVNGNEAILQRSDALHFIPAIAPSRAYRFPAGVRYL